MAQQVRHEQPDSNLSIYRYYYLEYETWSEIYHHPQQDNDSRTTFVTINNNGRLGHDGQTPSGMLRRVYLQRSDLFGRPQICPNRALSHHMCPYNAVRVSIPNLGLLLQSAARAGQPASVKDLIHFAFEHGVPLGTLITSDALLAALDGGSLDVLRLFVAARPETANLDLGHLEDPLVQALHRQQFDHARTS